MTMAATTSSGDITDMDCSPAELDELIKEVRLPPLLYRSFDLFSHLSFTPISHLFVETLKLYCLLAFESLFF